MENKITSVNFIIVWSFLEVFFYKKKKNTILIFYGLTKTIIIK